LILLGNDIYTFGESIVKPLQNMDKNYTDKKLRVLESRSLQEEMTRLCKFWKYDGRSKKDVRKDCPQIISETYLCRDGA
jgi:hypothetical protein